MRIGIAYDIITVGNIDVLTLFFCIYSLDEARPHVTDYLSKFKDALSKEHKDHDILLLVVHCFEVCTYI